MGGRPSPPDQLTTTTRSSSRRPPPARAKLGQPFTRWSLRKLADLPAPPTTDRVVIGSAANGCGRSCAEHGITFQRTRTWKESTDPDRDAKLDRIEQVTTGSRTGASRSTSSGRCRSGPATASAGRRRAKPDRLPATYTPHPRHPLLPRLLLPRRRPALGRDPPPQGRRSHPGRAEDRSAPPARTAPRST